MALAAKVDPRLLALVWKRERDSRVHLLSRRPESL